MFLNGDFYERFKEKANGDEEILNALISEDKRKAGKAYDDMLASQREAEEKEQQDEIKALAEEFNLLQTEIPEFNNKKFESVPDEVLKIREKNNISLFDAYLRYQNSNRLKAEKEKQKQSDNSIHSTGSATGENGNDKPKWEQDLMSGIWG